MPMEKEIYLDHASTTYVDPVVKEAMDRYMTKDFGNPSSLNTLGLHAKEAIDNARESVAMVLNCSPSEIIFTGSGTESNNLAIQGVAKALKGKGRHIITSKIEHSSVLNVCKALEEEGFEVAYIDVDRNGLVNCEKLEKAIRPDTILISIMYANNEIGAVQPVSDIGKIARKHNVYFHTDACQAAGAFELDVDKLGVDLLTVNGGKIYGPKGVGALYIRQGVKIKPIIHGGGQEKGLRSGTENVPGIVGFAKALELAEKFRPDETKRLSALRDKLVADILKKIPKSFLNGHPTKRLPNNVNVTILDVEGESLVLHLNECGVYVSTKSACSSKKLETSHVLKALGLPSEAAHCSIRLTLGKKTTEEDIDSAVEALVKTVGELRKISPVRLKPSQIFAK